MRKIFRLHAPAAALCLALLLGCGGRKAQEQPDTTDTREAIETQYVGAPELKVHRTPDAASPVVTTFLNGESISVMSRKGDWTEVRTTEGTGWALTSDITNAAAAAKEEEAPTPKFRKPPYQISQPGAKGTIYIEANVSTTGDVTSAKVLTNTTGSATLAARNLEALQQSKFYPIVQKGERKSFIYYYRIDY